MKHLATLLLLLTIPACQAPREDTAVAPSRDVAAATAAATGHECGHDKPAAAKPAAAGHEACGDHAQAQGAPAAQAGESCGGEKGGHESCGACGDATKNPIPDTAVTTRDPATGAAMTTVGAKLGAGVPVKVGDLLARPRDYAGKTVRVEGNVSAMCQHRRAWFAVASEDRSGNAVRVFAAPSFLVPPGSIGKKARTEGTIEVAEVGGGVRVTLRASGAEFM